MQFRISDLSQGDESGGTFKVDNIELVGTPSASSVTLLAPNGGQNLMTGDTFGITWTTGGGVDFVTLEYSLNNGVAWTEIDTVAVELCLSSITVGVNGGINDRTVAKVPSGALSTGPNRNMGIITGSIAGSVSDCASLASLHAEPTAAKLAPNMTIARSM